MCKTVLVFISGCSLTQQEKPPTELTTSIKQIPLKTIEPVELPVIVEPPTPLTPQQVDNLWLRVWRPNSRQLNQYFSENSAVSRTNGETNGRMN